MKNTKGVDKDIQFKKSKKTARGFFTWSQDTVSKIIQVCWLDRNPGCKKCNVALCQNEDCWRIFHTQFQGSSQPYNMKYWQSSDEIMSD